MALASALALGLVAAPAQAQDGGQPGDSASDGAIDLDKARVHYRDAETAMASGDYATAADEYTLAHQHSRDPILFFKIGDAHQKAGDCAKALESYRAYLAQGNPDDKFKAMTERRISRCDAIIRSAGGTPPAPGDGGDTPAGSDAGPASGDATDPTPADSAADGPTTTLDPPDDATDSSDASDPTGTAGPLDGAGEKPPTFAGRGGSWQRDAAWISVGLTVALVSAGGVLTISAGSREEDIQNLLDFRDIEDGQPRTFDGNTRARYEELIDEGEQLETFSAVAFAAAGAAAVAAAVFFYLDLTSSPDSSPGSDTASRITITPAISDREIGAFLRWEL